MPPDPKKILVVEDNPDVLLIIKTALHEKGYDVITADGGEEGLAQVKQNDFDLILTDLAMPKVSGVDLISALKNAPGTWRIPIVAVTAHWTDQISVSASAAGCDGFIAKPFSREELLYEVEKHLALRKQA
jgi:CheY-like chemotaxis protein